MTEALSISNSLLRDSEKMLNRLLAHHVDRNLPEWDQADRLVDQISAALNDAPPLPFQQCVTPWMLECFGPDVSADKLERCDRWVEEVYEALQWAGYPRDRLAMLENYTWSRPVGEGFQEAGGVMVTFAAWCDAHGIDMHEAGRVELARVWTKVDQIRAKQASKPKGSPLPQHVAIEVKPGRVDLTDAEKDRILAEEVCMACGDLLMPGDPVYDDASSGILHAGCCGPERESYTFNGEPLGPDNPIPEPRIWARDGQLAPAILTREQFLIVVAHRLIHRAALTHEQAASYAVTILDGHLDTEGVEFGATTRTRSWDADDARELADEELSNWEG